MTTQHEYDLPPADPTAQPPAEEWLPPESEAEQRTEPLRIPEGPVPGVALVDDNGNLHVITDGVVAAARGITDPTGKVLPHLRERLGADTLENLLNGPTIPMRPVESRQAKHRSAENETEADPAAEAPTMPVVMRRPNSWFAESAPAAAGQADPVTEPVPVPWQPPRNYADTFGPSPLVRQLFPRPGRHRAPDIEDAPPASEPAPEQATHEPQRAWPSQEDGVRRSHGRHRNEGLPGRHARDRGENDSPLVKVTDIVARLAREEGLAYRKEAHDAQVELLSSAHQPGQPRHRRIGQSLLSRMRLQDDTEVIKPVMPEPERAEPDQPAEPQAADRETQGAALSEQATQRLARAAQAEQAEEAEAERVRPNRLRRLVGAAALGIVGVGAFFGLSGDSSASNAERPQPSVSTEVQSPTTAAEQSTTTLVTDPNGINTVGEALRERLNALNIDVSASQFNHLTQTAVRYDAEQHEQRGERVYRATAMPAGYQVDNLPYAAIQAELQRHADQGN